MADRRAAAVPDRNLRRADLCPILSAGCHPGGRSAQTDRRPAGGPFGRDRDPGPYRRLADG